MTEKNIFAYKLILSLNISDFNLFLSENCNPRPPVTHLFPSSPPLKIEVLPSPRFEDLVGGSIPCRKGEGAHYAIPPPLITAPTTHFSNFLFFICEVPTNSFSISESNFGTPHFHDFSDVHMNKKLQKNHRWIR